MLWLSHVTDFFLVKYPVDILVLENSCELNYFKISLLEGGKSDLLLNPVIDYVLHKRKRENRQFIISAKLLEIGEIRFRLATLQLLGWIAWSALYGRSTLTAKKTTGGENNWKSRQQQEKNHKYVAPLTMIYCTSTPISWRHFCINKKANMNIITALEGN